MSKINVFENIFALIIIAAFPFHSKNVKFFIVVQLEIYLIVRLKRSFFNKIEVNY